MYKTFDFNNFLLKNVYKFYLVNEFKEDYFAFYNIYSMI